ncbi:unnamed protein product [Paramecium primaurelia]|uniref:Opioid growth factor receptor (OGFr) conserved domain-containing protein n=2 Tax=Paramecium TaxID=5884 RepID=A0A8S1UNL5_9CILI|nr:unnamed protein product [Paramecium primaurelia]CAD8166650.1 unnamed protein product [Paramecium pentaurelia]
MGMCESREELKDTQFGRSTIQPKMSEYPNLDFYKGVYPFQLNNQIQFHIKHWKTYNQPYQWIKFYSDLESDKQFMQWLYPNFFQSFLNTTSFRLSIKERNSFIEDESIMKQYLDNIKMFQRFLGIGRDESQQLQILDQQQFDQCIYSYTQNQVRIQRFISSMSILGQRELALELLQVIKNKLTKKNKIYQSKFQGFELLVEELDLSAQSLFSKKKPTKSFGEYKTHYVQEDLLNEPWVQASILTKAPIIVIQDKRESFEIKQEV